MSGFQVEEARRRLIARVVQRSLFDGTDLSTAAMGLFAGLSLAAASWVAIIVVFRRGVGPMPEDAFFALFVGFGLMFYLANRYVETQKVKDVQYLKTASDDSIADQYCRKFHPDRGEALWRRMSELRDANMY